MIKCTEKEEDCRKMINNNSSERINIKKMKCGNFVNCLHTILSDKDMGFPQHC
jgi:hypothetical protein